MKHITMKKRINILKAKKRSHLWGTLLLIVLLFSACTSNLDFTNPDIVNPETGKALVTLNINTPQPLLPGARAQSPNETHISEVKILVFEKSDEEYKFSYHVNATEIASSVEQTQLKVLLATTDAPVKLIMLANANDAFTNNAPETGMTEAEGRDLLNKLFTSEGLQGSLPMYGELYLSNGINSSETYMLPVTALRSVARIDVVKNLNPDAPEFILEEVYAFRSNNRIQLIPNQLEGGSSPKVSKPSVPTQAAALQAPVMKRVPGGTESIIQLYLPESSEVITNTEKVKEATTIVIGGRFGGSDNPVTYYRADFNSGIAGHPFGQVLRNHRYIFKIKNVSREGWPTPGEAADNLSSLIIVDVQLWEDFSSEMYLGDDRFGVSSREISLRYVRNREHRIDVESTYIYQIQWLKNGVPVGDATSEYDRTISNDTFDVRIVREATDKEHVTHLVFRTRKDNHLGNIITDTLRITAGQWKVDIAVSQDNSAMYSNRCLHILTVEGIGDLGVNMVDPGASGLAMRKILDKQFGTNGTIRIGGSSFTRIPNTVGYAGTSASENLSVLNRIFGSQDVIYFPHGVSISSAVADLLIAWIEANPYRVLIVGTDSESSNKQLREKPKIASNGIWAFSDVATITSSYARAIESSENEEFFNGPFGTVAENAQFSRADNIAGYLPSYSPSVTPLIVSNKAGYTDYMFFGINKSDRIVFHGDSQLFMTNQISNNSGNVTSNLDILMANTWAWIVEQVIYGNSQF